METIARAISMVMIWVFFSIFLHIVLLGWCLIIPEFRTVRLQEFLQWL